MMKKRFTAVFLAVALCLGLCVPAFAADSEVPEGSYTVNLDKPDPAEMGVDGEFTVRYLTSGRSYDEPKPRIDITRTIPQGSEFTWIGLRPSYNTWFRFFTDLDNDGTYDERLVVKESGKNVLAPYEENYASSLTQVSGKMQSAGTFAIMLEEMGGELEKDSSGVMTLTISSDSLCQFFGGSTLFEWGIMRGGGSDTIAKGTMLFAAEEDAAEPEPSPAFTDVPEWCSPAVDWAVGQKITDGKGDNKFAPGDQCTNAEILTFLWRAADKPASDAPLPADITGKNLDYAETALRWANGLGMVDPGSFDPSTVCTRAQAVKFIWMAFTRPDADKSEFTDVPADADYAAAVNWAAGLGITNGYGDEFRPDEVCSRGQIVTFLHRAYVPEARLSTN